MLLSVAITCCCKPSILRLMSLVVESFSSLLPCCCSCFFGVSGLGNMTMPRLGDKLRCDERRGDTLRRTDERAGADVGRNGAGFGRPLGVLVTATSEGVPSAPAVALPPETAKTLTDTVSRIGVEGCSAADNGKG